jgi:hypothetical protein
MFVCLFIGLYPHEPFFSYLADVTITVTGLQI